MATGLEHAESTESALRPLFGILRSTRDVPVVSAALIATARLGNGLGEETKARIAATFVDHLGSESQEISETSALSLGILGTDRALEVLLQILAADDEGAVLVDREVIPERTRAFAAYGLGLMAHRRDTSTLRQRIAASLMEALSSGPSSDDLAAAAMLSLGLCPAPLTLTVPGEATRLSPHAHDVVSRSAQLRWLHARVASSRRPKEAKKAIHMSLPTLCHAIVALGRLARYAPDPARREALVLLEDFVTKQSAHAHLRTSAVIALGQAMTCGHRPADRAGRQGLVKILESGQALERRFASIALAEASSVQGPATPISGDVDGDSDPDPEPNPESDPAGFAGLDSVNRALLRKLALGRSSTLPWFAMALGIQRVRLEQAGVPWDETIALAMRRKLQSEKDPSLRGAFALATALVHQGADEASAAEAGVQVHRALERTMEGAPRAQMAIALGLLRFEPAREDLIKLMENSRFNPDVLQSASVALMMYDEPSVIPRLLEMLKKARSSSVRASASAALGRVGDSRAIEPLLELARNRLQPSAVRAFALVSLGQICESSPLPWRTPVSHATPYFAVTGALQNGSSGLLDLN
jgi:HEAT repeat protein